MNVQDGAGCRRRDPLQEVALDQVAGVQGAKFLKRYLPDFSFAKSKVVTSDGPDIQPFGFTRGGGG